MNVSRETSLPSLLSRIASDLKIDKTSLRSNQSLSGLTISAASLLLLSINSIYKKPFLVIVNSSVLSEKLYLSCYNLTQKDIALFPESPLIDMEISGFNLENERYRTESLNLFRKNTQGVVFASSNAVNELSIECATEEEVS